MVAIATGFAAALLAGQRQGVGRILVTVSAEHGVHTGDLPVVGLWVLAVTCGVLLWRDPGSS